MSVKDVKDVKVVFGTYIYNTLFIKVIILCTRARESY
jgi:hypothetical protein